MFLDTDQKSIAPLFPKGFSNKEDTYELNKIVEMENKLEVIQFIKQVIRKRIKQLIFKSLKQ